MPRPETPQETIETRIEQNGNVWHVVASYGAREARQRVPCHVRKLTDAGQQELLHMATKEAIRKLLKDMKKDAVHNAQTRRAVRSRD